MIADFLHFYPSYKLEDVLKMYAISFYALVSSMYRLKAQEDLRDISVLASSNSEQGLTRFIKEAQERAEGADKILKEVETLRNARR